MPLNCRSVKTLYLDESGDHSLRIIDPQYPVFVLAGVLVETEYGQKELEQAVSRFKDDLFGRSDFVLRTADICRNRGVFEPLKNRVTRESFYEELNRLMRDLEYQVLACAIDKPRHARRYGSYAFDPYMLSLEVLVERLCYEVSAREGGQIIAEKRNHHLDKQLELAWQKTKESGTSFVSAQDVQEKIRDLRLRSKQDNIAGLQLADLVASPIGRHVIGKKPKEDFRIVESKLRRNWKGDYKGFGLVVLPR